MIVSIFRKNRRLLAAVAAVALGPLAVPGWVDAESNQEQFRRDPDPRTREARTVFRTPQRVFALPRTDSPWRQAAFGRRGDTGIPDFGGYQDVEQKKLSFFAWMLPLVEEENRRLRDVRQRLTYVHDHVRWGRQIDDEDRAWLEDLRAEFRLGDLDPATEEFWHVAFRRVDILPDHLVVVQAANESAWGTSRFAREGNNLFGQWCFEPGCGIVPAGRPDGAVYEVARFDSAEESVGSYMRNLNTGRSYRELREIRAGQRAAGDQPDAVALADGLVDYSERGQDYVAEIRAMIRYNADLIEEARLHSGLASS